jgi:hypothetical protein
MEVKKFLTIKQAVAQSGRSGYEIRMACKNGSIKEVVQCGCGQNAKYRFTVDSFNQWCEAEFQMFKTLNGIAS